MDINLTKLEQHGIIYSLEETIAGDEVLRLIGTTAPNSSLSSALDVIASEYHLNDNEAESVLEAINKAWMQIAVKRCTS